MRTTMRPMLRSLRFRLPALFLLGFVIAALVATAIALRLFQDYTRQKALKELRRESAGAVHLYEVQEGRNSVSPVDIEQATGDQIFWIPIAPRFTLFQPLKQLPSSAIDFERFQHSDQIQFELTPPHSKIRYLAVARQFELK